MAKIPVHLAADVTTFHRGICNPTEWARYHRTGKHGIISTTLEELVTCPDCLEHLKTRTALGAER